MVLKSEQQQIRTLLIEAVTMLCKNGLRYRSKFSIEGLIGITLDDNEVLLVSIQETFRSDLGRFLKNGDNTEQHVPLNLSPAPPLSPASTTQAASPAHIKSDQINDAHITSELNLSLKTEALQNDDTCSNSPISLSHKRSHEDSRVPPLHEPPDDSESSNSQTVVPIPAIQNMAHSSDEADEPPFKRAHHSGDDSDSDRRDVILVKEEGENDSASDNDIDNIMPNSEPIRLPNLGQTLGGLRANPSTLNFDGCLDMNTASSSSLLFSSPPGCSAWDPSTSLVPSSGDITPTSSVLSAALSAPPTQSSQSQVGVPPGLQLPPGVLLVQQPGGLPTGIVYIRPKGNDAPAAGLLPQQQLPPASAANVSKAMSPLSTSVPLTQPAGISLLPPSVPGIRSPFLMPKPIGGFPTPPTPLLPRMAPPNVNVNDLLVAKIAQQMGGLPKHAPAPPKKPIPPAAKKKAVLEFTPPSNRKYRFSCLECSYTTNRRYNIERHMRTHGSEGLITADQVRYEEVTSANDDLATKENAMEEGDRAEGMVCSSPIVIDGTSELTKDHDAAEHETRNDLGLDTVIIEETEGTVIKVEENLLESSGSDKLDK